MTKLRVFGVILIVAGVVGLAYGGFTYTSKTHRANIGSLTIALREKETVNVPIWAGVGLIAGGGALLFVGSKKKKRRRS